MTAICSGGTSSPKPGVASSVIVDQAFVQSLLPPGLAWVYPYLPFMHGLEIGDVGAFCALDPPTWTVPDATDIYNFIVGGPLASVALVNQFLQDLTKAYLWYSLCKCDSVATPAPPAAPGAPAGLPAINPPTVVRPAPTVACFDSGAVAAASRFCGGNTGGLSLPYNVNGLNITAVRVTVTESNIGGAGFLGQMRFAWLNTVAILRNDISAVALGPGVTTHIFPAPPAGALSGQPNVVGTGATGVDCADFTSRVEYFCNGDQPGGFNSACCPPDPNLTAMLTRVDQLVQLIQRQIAPFASIDGPSHAGLAGNGHIDVTEKMLGIRVQLTTIPAAYGRSDGDPLEYFDLGFVHLGDGDQWFGSRQLEQSTSIWQPRWAGMATRIGYTLSPGVVATVTELRREP